MGELMSIPPHVREMADRVEADESYDLRCIIGGEKVFLAEDTQARMPGHIYSAAGHSEYALSGCCEHHFDAMFAGEDD